jgi:hypothetical protein
LRRCAFWAAAIFLFAFLAVPVGAINCNIAGTPVACPFDFTASFHVVCPPTVINNSVRIDVTAPSGWSVEKIGTSVLAGGKTYSQFFQDGNTLFFPVPGMTKSGFSSLVTLNGVTGNGSWPGNTSTCPCSLERKGFSVRYDESSGREILQGAVSGSSGCATDGTVAYRTIFFITKGNSTEVVSGTSTGDSLDLVSTKTYLSDDPVSFQVAVIDAARGVVYGVFTPEVFRPNDFSLKFSGSQPFTLIADSQGNLTVNVTNLGTVTEQFSVGLEGLPTGWQVSSTTTRPLAPGESALASVGVIAVQGLNSTSARITGTSLITAKTRTIPISFTIGRNVAGSAELYSSGASLMAGESFDLTAILRSEAYAPEERIYWTVLSNPPARLGIVPSGWVPAAGTTSRSNGTFLEKTDCAGSPSYQKLWIILKAIVANTSKIDGLAPKLALYSNGTTISSEVNSFASAKNRTLSAASSLLSKIEAAQLKDVYNCTGTANYTNLSIFGIDTLNFGSFESAPVRISLAGKETGISISGPTGNISIAKGGTATAVFTLRNALPVEKLVSLKAEQTTFKIDFPDGAVVKVPARGSLQSTVTISDKGTIAKTGELLQIDATATDASGEPATVSASTFIQIRTTAFEMTAALPSQLKVEPGASKSSEFKFRNAGNAQETFVFSASGAATLSPQTITLAPGATGSVNVTASVDSGATDGSKRTVTISAKTESTGETASFKMDVLVTSTAKGVLSRNLEGLENSVSDLEQTCRYYNLKKLKDYLTTAKERYDRGEYISATSAYNDGRIELEVAKQKCPTPDTGMTVLVIVGVVIVVGGLYYFIFVRKKPATIIPQQQFQPPRYQ